MATESCRCKRQKVLNGAGHTHAWIYWAGQAQACSLFVNTAIQTSLNLAVKFAGRAFNPVKAAPWLRSPAAPVEDPGPACKPRNMENCGKRQTSKTVSAQCSDAAHNAQHESPT